MHCRVMSCVGASAVGARVVALRLPFFAAEHELFSVVANGSSGRRLVMRLLSKYRGVS